MTSEMAAQPADSTFAPYLSSVSPQKSSTWEEIWSRVSLNGFKLMAQLNAPLHLYILSGYLASLRNATVQKAQKSQQAHATILY